MACLWYMKTQVKVLVLTLFALLMTKNTSGQFLTQPAEETLFVPLNNRVVLSCSVEDGHVVDWVITLVGDVDDAREAANTIDFRDILTPRNFTFVGVNSRNSTASFGLLNAAGEQANNATIIACVAQKGFDRVSGNRVQVIFYDAPPPPTDLNVTENELNFFNISWSLGFIEGVPVNYTLIVLNLNTTSAQPIIIAGLLDQYYVFETSRPCDVYSFTVTAVTAAGNSTPSQKVIFTTSGSNNLCTTAFENPGLSHGGIAGIVIGVLTGVLIAVITLTLIFVIFCVWIIAPPKSLIWILHTIKAPMRNEEEAQAPSQCVNATSTSTSITVTWDPVSSADISHYFLRCTDVKANDLIHEKTTTMRSATFDCLNSETTYKIEIVEISVLHVACRYFIKLVTTLKDDSAIVSTDAPPQQKHPVTIATAVASPHHDDLMRQRVCERVLKAKSLIPIIVVIMNYLGLPRSGKTSFRRRITNEIENILEARKRGEVEQPSTGILEDGGQVLIKSSCQEMGVISRSKIWSVIKDLGDEANMLNQFFHQIVPDVKSEKKSGTKEGVDDTKEKSKLSQPLPSSLNPKKTKGQQKAKMTSGKEDSKVASSNVSPETDHDFDDAGEDKSAITRAAPSNISAETDSNIDDEDEDFFAIIREAMSTEQREEVKYLLEDTILLANNDTGGHAEFLDLQAALVQGPSFNLLFSRLVDDLESLFKICYTNEEGKSTDKEESTMTVEEVLYQSLSSIACFSGAFSDDTPAGETEQSQSKAMFIGTHLDGVTEEEFKVKDEHLRKKIERTEFYKKGIVKYVSEDQLMLPVNNLSGDQDEIKGIQEILEEVIKNSFLKISIPAAWLVLSLYLRKKKFHTISLKKCEKLASKLGISPEELQEALWFLHHHVGVLLYYPKVEAMKDTVICQMQVVFDSASNLIRNTFTFDRVGKYASKKFREKGQFSLKDVKKATSGHTDSLIPLEKLVMLLQHLNVLTLIPPSPSSEDDLRTPEPIYFMPCVLQSARASELKVTTSSEDPPPLLLRYECGYVPVGVFPAMITNLVSQQQKGWNLIQKGLYKNKVQFQIRKNYDILTLISRPRYLEITLSQNEKSQTPISTSLCGHVRGIIKSTLITVTSRMNYHFKMGYKFGFDCPTHPGREHLCVLASENEDFMECLDDPDNVEAVQLEAKHRVWFTEDNTKGEDVDGSNSKKRRHNEKRSLFTTKPNYLWRGYKELKVFFMNNDQKYMLDRFTDAEAHNQIIVSWMNEWSPSESSFVPKFVIVHDIKDSDVRIAYGEDSNTYIGMEAHNFKDEPSMKLNLIFVPDFLKDLPAIYASNYKKYTVLHETGHTLGFYHEHQHSIFSGDIFERSIIIDDLQEEYNCSYKMANNIYDSNFAPKPDPEFVYPFNRDSIMKIPMKIKWVRPAYRDLFFGGDDTTEINGYCCPRCVLSGTLTYSDITNASKVYDNSAELHHVA